MWFSVARFWCQSFCNVSPYTFSLVWVAEWPPFGKELAIRLAVWSHCILSICNFSYFPFGFESEVWFLICSSSCSLLTCNSSYTKSINGRDQCSFVLSLIHFVFKLFVKDIKLRHWWFNAQPNILKLNHK